MSDFSPFPSEERRAFWRSLCAPFVGNEVRTRDGTGGKKFSYVTARTVMNRLDSVAGPENWFDEYRVYEKGVICTLTIRLQDGSLVSKQDCGAFAGMADGGDDEKSAYSDAFKRAAVKFGISRNLYGDGVPDWIEADPGPTSRPNQSGPAAQPPAQRSSVPTNNNGEPQWNAFAIPKVNPEKAVFFAWAKKLEEHFQVNLIGGMKKGAENRGFTTTFKDWTQDEANQVAKGVILHLKGLSHYKGEFDNVKLPDDPAPGTPEDDDIPF